jgi:hypothetical protein
MAASLSTERVPWLYTDGVGNTYRIATQEAVVSQGKSGGSLAAATVPLPPKGFKPRRATVHQGGISRQVILFDATQTLVVGTVYGTINLNVGGVASQTFTAFGTIQEEKYPRRSGMYQAS